jgi:hypothetical protein
MNNNSYSLLDETSNTVKRNFIFNSKLVLGNDSPYNYEPYFNNLDYNEFVYRITQLVKYNILDEEIKFLKTYYGKKKINNVKVTTLIKKNMNSDLIHTFIITKRLEFLLEFYQLKNNNNYMSYINYTNYTNYINKTLSNLYKTIKYLVNLDYCK